MFKPSRVFGEQRLLAELLVRAATHVGLARTGEVAKGGGATVQEPTAQDALVEMEIAGNSFFAHRLIDTVLSRYPMAI